jgi:arylsulfatase A-like enzyme
MVGLVNPHEPMESPARFYEDYPIESIIPPDWKGDAPPSGLHLLGQRIYRQLVRTDGLDDYIQGYLANIAEMDYHLGRLLDAIEASETRPTIILTSDHGYSLGDHDYVSKFTLWDEAGRAPLIIVRPGALSDVRYEDVVSLLDIAPTFLDFAGLDIPVRMDGRSLAPFTIHRATRRTIGAMTTMNRTNLSFRANRYRVTQYEDGAVELYDQWTDPFSTNNLADDRDYAVLRNRMIVKLEARYRNWTASN